MICSICEEDIESNQSRHSDALGNYHILCEFNVVRNANGLPPYESLKDLRRGTFYDLKPVIRTDVDPDAPPTISRVQLNLAHKPRKSGDEFLHIMLS